MKANRSTQPSGCVDTSHRPDWNSYYMEMAGVASKRSLVPTVNVGAVIIGRTGTVISTGYNDFCRGVKHLCSRYADPVKKRLFTIHAEENSIIAAARIGSPLDGATIYITQPPCSRCLNAIIQAGIHDCYYLTDTRPDDQLNERDHIEEEYRLAIQIELAGEFALYQCVWSANGKLHITRPLHPEDAIRHPIRLDQKSFSSVKSRKIIFL